MKKRFLAIVLLLAIACAFCIGASASIDSTSSPFDEYTTVTIKTAGGADVEAKKYTSEISAAYAALLNERVKSLGATQLAAPTIKYNCHSYAWHKMSVNNTYCIERSEISLYLGDSNCTQITSTSQLQPNDIVLYYGTDGFISHSAVIHSIEDDGTLVLRSKWGPGGLYEHSLQQVPQEYKSYDFGGNLCVQYYRYHDFGNSYTGNNYHYDNKHFFEYIGKCSVCGLTQGNAFWTSGPCAGPPCNTPFSVPSEDAAA